MVSQDRIFLTSALVDEEGLPITLQVACLDAPSGETLWIRDVLEPGEGTSKHGKNSHASPTPVVEEGRVYAHFGHYGTVCLDVGGRLLWRQTSLGYQPVHGNGSSPLLVGSRLIFSADGAQGALADRPRRRHRTAALEEGAEHGRRAEVLLLDPHRGRCRGKP